MIGYNFTSGVRKALAMAREEAARLHHEYVGTEHMLLGLLRRDDGVAMAVLHELDLDVERMRTQIEEMIKRGRASQFTGPDLPYTSRAKAVLELAMNEARQLGHSYVGSEHLLLGLLSEGKGVAAQVLTTAGLTAAAARETILRLLGSEGALHPSHPSQGELSPRHIPNLVVVQLRYEGGWTHRREFRTAAEAMAFLAGR